MGRDVGERSPTFVLRLVKAETPVVAEDEARARRVRLQIFIVVINRKQNGDSMRGMKQGRMLFCSIETIVCDG